MAKINTTITFTDGVSAGLQRMNQNVEKSVSGFSGLSSKIITVNQTLSLLSKGINAVKQIGGVFGGLIAEAGATQSIISRLTVAFGDYDTAVQKYKELEKFAEITPFDVQGTANAYIMFKNAGMEVEELLPMIRMMGDLAQGNSEAFNNMAMNIMQIKARGSAELEDIKQFSTFGVPIMQTLKELGLEKNRSFDAIRKAMIHLTSEGGKFYNSMSIGASTLEGRMSTLSDTISQFKTVLGNTMLPVVQKWQNAFATFFAELKNWFQNVAKLGEPLQNFFDSLYGKLNSLIAFIIYLGTVATIVATAMAVAWAVANWPITLTVLLLGTLIRIIFDIIDSANNASIAMNGFGNQCASAGQIFGTVVGFIVGTIKGLVNIVYNAFATVYNAVMIIVEFFANVFTSPIDAIKGLFLNLVSVILDALSTIAGPLDIIFKGKITSALNSASAKIQQFKKDNVNKNGKEDYITGVGAKGGLLHLKDINNAFEYSMKGFEVGNSLGGLIDMSFAGITPSTPGTSDIPTYELPEFKTDGSGNLMVSDPNLVDMTDDWRDLLSKQATEKFNLEFSQVTPMVEVGEIVVNNGTDVDSIVDKLVEGVEQAQHGDLRG